MAAHPKNPARLRYLIRFFTTLAAYVLLFNIADSVFHHHHPTGTAAIALAIAPALAILAGIVVVALYIAEEQDEFQRTLFIRSILWGIAVTLAFTTVHGFLELYTPIQKFPLNSVYRLFWIVVILAQTANAFYYRPRND
jgi:fructose-specific phosphotransferase system IIC component